MGEIITAVLLVSILWILWDMAKMFLREKPDMPDGSAMREPGRQRLNQYAEAFERLSETFLKLPEGRAEPEKEDMEQILANVSCRVCENCASRSWCYREHPKELKDRAWEQLKSLGNDEAENYFLDICETPELMVEELSVEMRLFRQELLFQSRLSESREILMDQFREIAEVIRRAAGSIYEISRVEPSEKHQIETQMRLHGISIRELWKVEQQNGRRELYITMKALGKKRCIGVKKAAACLSGVCGEPMVQARDSRMIINHDYNTVMFQQAPSYTMLCGAARVTRDGEVVSGDNFSVLHKDSGQMILSISDGMGSGPEAGAESSRAIELMEQFLNAGFDKETSIRMIHSVMLLKESRCFSTMDLAAVDLYTGECEFLKVGASTTFLKRGGFVETISSTSMPMGILGRIDYEQSRKKLHAGDFLIMVSDGILEAFDTEDAEEILKELILHERTDNAGEMAKRILDHVLQLQKNKAADDMTVLVGGLWRR